MARQRTLVLAGQPNKPTPTKLLLRGAFGALSPASETINEAIKDRLFQTIIDRRKTLFLGFAATFMLASAAVFLSGARWPFFWMGAELVLLSLRWTLAERAAGADKEARRRYANLLTGLATIWAFFLGLAVFACIASSVAALTAITIATASAVSCAISSRNAATPRHAFIMIAMICGGVAAAAATSSEPHMLLLAALMPFVAATCAMLVSQNHALLLRLIKAELTARTMADTDMLTGLFNRSYLAAHLTRLAEDPFGPRRYSMFYVDLDGFKLVNDLHGHAAGDELLRATSRRILGAVRASDLVFRLGGDEFLILSPETGPQDCEALAARIIAAISSPVQLRSGLSICIGASIGSASASEIGASPESVIHAADTALYAAKTTGKGKHEHLAALAA